MSGANATPPRGTLSVYQFGGELPELSPDLVFHKVREDEAEMVQAVMDQAGSYAPGDVAQRLAMGKAGYLGKIANAEGVLIPVTYGWVAFDREQLGNSGRYFTPPEGDVWFYDFATLPGYRGHGYYPALLRAILHELSNGVTKRAWIGTAPGNDVSARSISRAGFTLVIEMEPKFGEKGEFLGMNPIINPNIPPELLLAAQEVFGEP
jgi:GNAT superfamily N-acetyltransferase